MSSTQSDDLHIRVPRKLKRAAQKVIEANGMDISGVVRLFFTHIALQNTIPLQFVSAGSGLPKKLEEELLELVKKNDVIGPFDDAESAIRAMHAHTAR